MTTHAKTAAIAASVIICMKVDLLRAICSAVQDALDERRKPES